VELVVLRIEELALLLGAIEKYLSNQFTGAVVPGAEVSAAANPGELVNGTLDG
jgi:hypothetical protein